LAHYGIEFLIIKRRVDRQRKHFLTQSLGNGKRLIISQSTIEGLPVDRSRVVYLSTNAIFPQVLKKQVSPVAHSHGVLMIHMVTALALRRSHNALKPTIKEAGVLATTGVSIYKSAELDKTDGGTDVGHSPVISQKVVSIALALAVSTQPASHLSHPQVIRGNHPSLTRCNVLCRIKGEAGRAKTAHLPITDHRSMGLTGILYNQQSMSVGSSAYLLHAAGMTVEMNYKDRLCPGCHRLLNEGRIDVEIVLTDIHKAWASASKQNGVG